MNFDWQIAGWSIAVISVFVNVWQWITSHHQSQKALDQAKLFESRRTDNDLAREWNKVCDDIVLASVRAQIAVTQKRLGDCEPIGLERYRIWRLGLERGWSELKAQEAYGACLEFDIHLERVLEAKEENKEIWIEFYNSAEDIKALLKPIPIQSV